MNGVTVIESDEFVETDPTGRYGRYNEVLGKGASKTVYRAFDEYEGIEVAWNQVKLNNFLQTPEDLERLYSEIHLLKTLKHKNIMKFYSSWVDTSKRNINFVTELFTSGTLRQYRQKHKKVNIRAVKHWCRQILRGLLYLHSLDPPVIHRDLKCDNIFINGNQGEVKIGDLGLAAILRKSHVDHCVGTPEFMAPEVYKEEYNELVDIYSFGMCILEMVTFDYPYSECTHPAQIYKKVISGKKPDALYKVKDPEVRRFVDKCLATVSLRLPARELLNDPFLQIDGLGADLRPLECSRKLEIMEPLRKQPLIQHQRSNSLINRFYREHLTEVGLEPENDCRYQSTNIKANGIEVFTFNDDGCFPNVDITIKGKRNDDDEILLRLRIADKEGRIRNIYFPFDIESDTALSVATEMVEELELTDQDVTTIADMIDGEMALLIPEWRVGLEIDETPRYSNVTLCQNCDSSRPSNVSLMNCLSKSPSTKNLPVLPCLKHGCASLRGRFEEVTYQVEESEHFLTDGAPPVASQCEGVTYGDVWAKIEGHELSSEGSGEQDESTIFSMNLDMEDDYIETLPGHHPSPITPSSTCTAEDDYESEIRHELQWMKARYQMELQDHLNGRLGGGHSSGPHWSPDTNNGKHKTENRVTSSPLSTSLHEEKDKLLLKSFGLGKHISCYFAPIDNSCPESETPRARHCEATGSEKMCFFASAIPKSLHRTTSLPVDAVDV